MFKNRSGFTLFELMVTIAIIGILTAILIPAVIKLRLRASQKICINNLRQIDQAIQHWTMDSRALPTDVVTHSNLVRYLRVLPVCPSPALGAGTFTTDYGMTFVKEEPFCIANNALEGTPHVFISYPSPRTNPPVASESKSPPPASAP